jgi:hypothetical protein
MSGPSAAVQAEGLVHGPIGHSEQHQFLVASGQLVPGPARDGRMLAARMAERTERVITPLRIMSDGGLG